MRTGAVVESAFDLLDAIDELYADAAEQADKRREHRLPYLRPLSLVSVDDPRPRPVAAFSRDLSPRGIGLLHESQIPPGEFVLTIPLTTDGHPVRLRAFIDWCEPFVSGWYLSGGQFLCVER